MAGRVQPEPWKRGAGQCAVGMGKDLSRAVLGPACSRPDRVTGGQDPPLENRPWKLC